MAESTPIRAIYGLGQPPSVSGPSRVVLVTADLVVPPPPIVPPAPPIVVEADLLGAAGALYYFQGRLRLLVFPTQPIPVAPPTPPVGSLTNALAILELAFDTAIPVGVMAHETTVVIPPNAVVFGVAVRVIGQPGGTTRMSVRGANTDHQFNMADIPTTPASVDPGITGCPFADGPGEPIRFVFDALTTDTNGLIRCAIPYYVVTPPSP